MSFLLVHIIHKIEGRYDIMALSEYTIWQKIKQFHKRNPSIPY